MNKEKKLVPKLRFPEFEIGSGWERRKIGDMLTETPRPIDLEDETDYCLVTVKRRYGGLVSRGVLKGKEIKVNSQFLVKAGDFVVSKRQIVHDACGLVPLELDGSVVSNEYSVLTARPGCSIDFFNWFAQQPCVSASFLECSVGIVIEKMLFKLPLWLRREFLFPAIAEQKKIADCLSSLDELIAAQARKVDALKTHKKGLMQQLFPREGETQPRLRFPEFRGAGEWEDQSIGNFGKVVTGNTPSTAQPAFYGGGIPFVSPADISDMRFVEQTKTTLTQEGYAQTRPIRAGSVLFVCIGSTIGKVAQNIRDCATNQQINAIIPNSKHSEGFVYFALSLASERIALLAGRQAVPIINKSLFSSVRILAPKLPEQHRIASFLSSIETLITHESQRLEVLKTHKKGLMQQIFPSLENVSV